MYALDDLYTSDFKVSANFALHSSPEFLSPYIALAVIITIPISVPKFEPASAQSLSLHFSGMH